MISGNFSAFQELFVYKTGDKNGLPSDSPSLSPSEGLIPEQPYEAAPNPPTVEDPNRFVLSLTDRKTELLNENYPCKTK